MSRIWTSGAAIPAAALTLATGNDNNQPILFTTQYGTVGTYETTTVATRTKLEWAIKSVDVTLVRDWNVSQAMITLGCSLPNVDDPIPPLPDVSSFRGGNYPYLWCEDEIRIYMGYVESPTTPITGDMLDEIPFTFDNLYKEKVRHNPNKPLIPVFWGFIDKVEFSGNAQGMNMVLSCRDRARIFADTRILSIQGLQGNSETAQTEGDSTLAGFSRGDRPSILMQLAAGASGNTTGSQAGEGADCSCWKPIRNGLLVKSNQTVEENLKEEQAFPDSAAWVRTAALTLMADKAEPRFHIWAERPPVVKGEANSVFQILNKTPLEIVDFLAKAEERPIDFYASHVNGDFIFGPRVLDTSGFYDETRAYRTYFFKSYPKELSASPPAPNQMILSMRSLSSTLATFNKFVIVGSQANGGQSSLLENIEQGFYVVPSALENRNPPPPCRTQVVYDGALDTYENPKQGSMIVGLAASRIWARDINGVQLELIGDPTWFPGEAVRVYNSVLHDKGIFVSTDQAASDTFQTQLKEEAGPAAEVAEDLTKQQKANACADSPSSQLAKKMFNENPGRVLTDSGNLILPIYKVRTIQHKLTATGKRGWTTTILATADY